MDLRQGFAEFWAKYPRKVGKLAAQKAYAQARTANGATQAELLAGIDAYVKHKPAYADFAHPSSWLRAGRWMDEWTGPLPSVQRGSVDWWEECKELHGGACTKRWDHEMKMRQAEAS